MRWKTTRHELALLSAQDKLGGHVHSRAGWGDFLDVDSFLRRLLSG